jgi:hypothetical protein
MFRLSTSISVVGAIIWAVPYTFGATAELTILNQNAAFNYANETNYLILQAQGGGLKNVRVAVIEFKTEDGQYLPSDTVEPVGTPADMATNSIQKIGFTFKAARIARPGAYGGTVSVVAEGETTGGQTAPSLTKVWTFKYQRNPVEFKVGDGTAKFAIVRCWPWSTAHAELPLGFRVTSDAQPTTLPVIIPGVLVRNDGNSATNIQGASISGALFDRATDPRSRQTSPPSTLQTLKDGKADLLIITDIPASDNDVSGKLKIHTSDLKSEVEIPVTFNVKDLWIWPFVVLLAGVLLSFLISNWSTKLRQHSINLATWQDLNAELANFLAQHVGAGSDSRVQAVQELLREARREGLRNDFDAEKKSLDSAQTKLNDIKANPPAPPAAAAAVPAPTVEMIEPASERTEDRILRFIIANPGTPPAGTVYTWRYRSGGAAWQPLGTAIDRLSYQHQFQQGNNFSVDVSYAGNTYASSPFDVLPSPATRIWERIEKTDLVITLFGVLLAAGIAYIPYSRAATFGGVADYVLAFAGGFGITEGTKGLASVLAKIRTS